MGVRKGRVGGVERCASAKGMEGVCVYGGGGGVCVWCVCVWVVVVVVVMVVWVSRLEGNQASSPTLNPHRLAMTRDILLLTLFVFI